MPNPNFNAALATEFKRPNKSKPVVLVDIESVAGNDYYLATAPFQFAVKLGAGPTAVYKPWVQSAGPFKLTRTLETDAGTLVLQNLSGNSLVRDAANLISADELGGALCVIRLVNIKLQIVEWEFHGILSQPQWQGASAQFRVTQLFDLNGMQWPPDDYSETCRWKDDFKGARCGSTGVAASCPGDLPSCMDASRAAGERFSGCPFAPSGLVEFSNYEDRNITAAPSSKMLNSGGFGGPGLLDTDMKVDYQVNKSPKVGDPIPWCYGPVFGSGNKLITVDRQPWASPVSGGGPHTWSCESLLGDGPWDGIDRLWVARLRVDPTDTTKCHFHQGYDGTLGAGLAPTSVGPDQGVDSFSADNWPGMPAITNSRIAYICWEDIRDYASPTPDIQLLGHYRSRLVRLFDNAGNQTAFQYSDNPAWFILDLIISALIKRDALANAALTAQEKTRLNFASFATVATVCDFNIGGGIKRFSGAGVAWSQRQQLSNLMSQLLMMCCSYIQEVNGQLYLNYDDQARASQFVLTGKHLTGDLQISDSFVRGDNNRYVGAFADLNPATLFHIDTVANAGAKRLSSVLTIKTVDSNGNPATHNCLVGDQVTLTGIADNTMNGLVKVASVPSETSFTVVQVGADSTSGGGTAVRDETRFHDATVTVNHNNHQLASGARGVGLARQKGIVPTQVPLGNNTRERVNRILKFQLVRNLGVDQSPYKAPRVLQGTVDMYAVDNSGVALLSLLNGDMITVDPTADWKGAGDYELMQIELPRITASGNDDLSLTITAKERVAAANTDVADTQPEITTSITRDLTAMASQDTSGQPYMKPDPTAQTGFGSVSATVLSGAVTHGATGTISAANPYRTGIGQGSILIPGSANTGAGDGDASTYAVLHCTGQPDLTSTLITSHPGGGLVNGTMAISGLTAAYQGQECTIDIKGTNANTTVSSSHSATLYGRRIPRMADIG